MRTKLALGTVQFGLDYGIANKYGRTTPDEVRRILKYAADVGIELLDTAPSYGASEQTLGSLLPGDSRFRLVTKTPVLSDVADGAARADYLDSIFRKSLEHLKRDSVYGLLVHRADDLLDDGGEFVWEHLEGLKAGGAVSRIGVSVYSGDQIERIANRYPIDIIQLPINVFDQRLIHGGHLSNLKSMGVEIHARSVFLQGLLLMDPSSLPSFFTPFLSTLERYHAFVRENSATPVQAALGFVANLSEIDNIVCGVECQAQLQEICEALSMPTSLDFSEFACDDEALVNPSRWVSAA